MRSFQTRKLLVFTLKHSTANFSWQDSSEKVPQRIFIALRLLRILFDVALDNFAK